MKRTLILLLAIVLCFAFIACNVTPKDSDSDIDSNACSGTKDSEVTNTDINNDTSSDIDSDSDLDSDSDVNSANDQDSPKLPEPSIVSYSFTQNDEYYSSAKFISNTYHHSLSYEFGQWYKIVKSYEELVQIDSETTVDQAAFQENYILVVHRYYNGGLYYDYIGYKNAKDTEKGFEITIDCYEPEELWTEEYREVESVEYLVVPKAELENVSVLEGKLILNYNERDFCERVWHSISEEKTSGLENGNIWIFNKATEYVELMKSYGVNRPLYDSALKDYTRIVIYFEKGTNIGIGYSSCNVTENEFYITNETLDGDNVILLEPALCVIIVPEPISFDEISKYNIIVQENIVETLH